jgi:sugar/nucleoside kinase (ribokinase family)
MLCAVGTIGLDRIETPHGVRDDCLGGSAIHFAYAASLFGPVRVVGVVGEDFSPELLARLAERRIDTAGIEVARGKTFRWSGRYFDDMDRRETISTELNVFADWKPVIPEPWRTSRTIFLANASPRLQLEVLAQMPKAELVVCDTMDLWITTERADLDRLFRHVHGVIINESEAVMFTGDATPLPAGKRLLELGPQFVVIKKGTHGSLLFTREGVCALPAYPVTTVCDPTGAGDSFAGGFLGYVNSRPARDLAELKRGLAYATCVASFNVEDFGPDRLARLDRATLDERVASYKMMLSIP